MSRTMKTAVLLLVLAIALAVIPLALRPGAEFGGSDDAGSQMVEKIQGKEYEPWFTPVLENLLGGELPVKAGLLPGVGGNGFLSGAKPAHGTPPFLVWNTCSMDRAARGYAGGRLDFSLEYVTIRIHFPAYCVPFGA